MEKENSKIVDCLSTPLPQCKELESEENHKNKPLSPLIFVSPKPCSPKFQASKGVAPTFNDWKRRNIVDSAPNLKARNRNLQSLVGNRSWGQGQGESQNVYNFIQLCYKWSINWITHRQNFVNSFSSQWNPSRKHGDSVLYCGSESFCITFAKLYYSCARA